MESKAEAEEALVEQAVTVGAEDTFLAVEGAEEAQVGLFRAEHDSFHNINNMEQFSGSVTETCLACASKYCRQ